MDVRTPSAGSLASLLLRLQVAKYSKYTCTHACRGEGARSESGDSFCGTSMRENSAVHNEHVQLCGSSAAICLVTALHFDPIEIGQGVSTRTCQHPGHHSRRCSPLPAWRVQVMSSKTACNNGRVGCSRCQEFCMKASTCAKAATCTAFNFVRHHAALPACLTEYVRLWQRGQVSESRARQPGDSPGPHGNLRTGQDRPRLKRSACSSSLSR